MAYQQMVEIMKAYRRDSEIIAFDEPTAPLTDSEIKILFQLIRQLKERGKIILYVSHRMAEIFQVTDDIVVLKDGHLVKTFRTAETNEKELITAMVGRDIGDTYANLKRNDKMGDVLLEVNNLRTDDVRDVSFQLRKGEVFGLCRSGGRGAHGSYAGNLRSGPDHIGRDQDGRRAGKLQVAEGRDRPWHRTVSGRP